MKYIESIKYVLILILAVSLSTSCTYDDVNQDPTRPGGDAVPLVAIVPAMQTQTHRNIEAVLGRYSGIITQQWQGFDAQQLQYTSYVIGENDTDNPWNFGLYTGSMRDAADIIERATNTDAPYTRGIAEIYMAINLGIATNMWGNVPYSEAFLGEENLTPKYDDQEELYGVIQQLLNMAITDLSGEDPAEIQGSLVDGSPADWIKSAHALKARFYLQQTSVSANAAQLALDEIALAVSSNIEQQDFFFENTQNGGHPLALFGLQRPNTMIIGDYFVDIMNDDPRKDLYMAPIDGGNFAYFENDNANLFWSQLDSPSPVISYAEVKFIEAEALQRTGGNALQTLKEAVRANMEYLGIANPAIEKYLITIITANIETIITEKYKAMYGQSSLQTWNDYRRTGFPTIIADPNGSNGNDPSGIIPRRLLYPITERLSNPNAYQNAIDAQGGHLLDDEIWVFPSK